MLSGDLRGPHLSAPIANPVRDAAARRRAVILVCCCTLTGAAAQILMKVGMTHFQMDLWAILSNFWLLAGYALYGLNTLLLVLALRDGQLSMLYPIIALTYVWVTLLSYTLLREPPNAFKNIGIATIMIGVAVLGRGGKK
jgi:uncharacterized membrane protein